VLNLGLGGTAELSVSELRLLFEPSPAMHAEPMSDALSRIVTAHEWGLLAALEETFARPQV